MRELAFLHQNAERWKAFESSLADKKTLDSDTLATLFIQLMDDLSYANTFYPNSKTTAYLQGLAARAHQQIYANKKEDRSRILVFWKEELPRVIRASHKEMLTALIVFLLAIAIGFISSRFDAGFVRLIMGDSYVNMTMENIRGGDPMAVYKSMSQWDMFLGITINNVRVSFFAFITGVFFSLGTGFMLFRNGVMVGAFQYLFYEQGLLMPAMQTIYIHGALELSAIVIAGGAGFVLGNSIMFPGTYTRLYSFLQGARQGVKLIIGLVPIFVVAGFLEAFVTRYTEMPLALSLFIIIGSFGLIIWYFVIYPIRKSRV